MFAKLSLLHKSAWNARTRKGKGSASSFGPLNEM